MGSIAKPAYVNRGILGRLWPSSGVESNVEGRRAHGERRRCNRLVRFLAETIESLLGGATDVGVVIA